MCSTEELTNSFAVLGFCLATIGTVLVIGLTAINLIDNYKELPNNKNLQSNFR